MREDVLAGRHAEQREPAGRIAHAGHGLEADVVRPGDQTSRDDVGHRVADQPDGRRRRRRSVRRHEAARHAYRRHRPQRDRDVRSLLAALERDLRRRAAVVAAGKYVVRYTAMRPVGDGGGGISTRFSVISATSPTCCVRGWPSGVTSVTPAKNSSLRSVESGARQDRGRHGGLRGGHDDDVRPGLNCESRNMPRSSVVAVGTRSALTSRLPYRVRRRRRP